MRFHLFHRYVKTKFLLYPEYDNMKDLYWFLQYCKKCGDLYVSAIGYPHLWRSMASMKKMVSNELYLVLEKKVKEIIEEEDKKQ